MKQRGLERDDCLIERFGIYMLLYPHLEF